MILLWYLNIGPTDISNVNNSFRNNDQSWAAKMSEKLVEFGSVYTDTFLRCFLAMLVLFFLYFIINHHSLCLPVIGR